MDPSERLVSPSPPKASESSPVSFQFWGRNEDVPSVILGNHYSTRTQVQDDLHRRVWLTYRTGFAPIPKSPDGPQPLSFLNSMIFSRNPLASTLGNVAGLIDNDNFTTDVGWGCMIRTSQTLLANALQQVDPGVDVLALFQDHHDKVFSLHNFVRVASALPLEVKPGQWFGPNAASLSIKRLCDAYDKSPFSVVISDNGDLYEDEVHRLLGTGPVLVLFPLRLGIDKVNQYYHDSLLQLLAVPQLVGIAGGKPASSLYFLGYQGDNLIYLDPHTPQRADDAIESYHTRRIQTLNINGLDPSLMAGILLRDEASYLDLRSRLEGNKIVHLHAQRHKAYAGNYDADDDFVRVDEEDYEVVPEVPDAVDSLAGASELASPSPDFVNVHPEKYVTVDKPTDFVDVSVPSLAGKTNE